MRTRRCDIVVVGAGPAGSLTSRTAAELGANVLLLEEHPQVGIPVHCAEGLYIEAIIDAGLKPVPPYVCQPIKRARVFAPNKKYVDLSFDDWGGYNLNRDEFDRALADNAVNAGAELLTETRATGVVKKGGKVVGVKAVSKGETIQVNADIVIGAEGYTSIVRRTAGFPKWYADATPVAQFQLSGVKIDTPHTNEVHIGREIAPGGYAWVFPKSSTTANVGLGVRLFNKGPALDYLKRFVASDPRFQDAKIMNINGGICPVSGVFEKIVDDGVMLVGDAAGQMMPMTGAGIHLGVASGKIAGEVAARAVQSGDVSRGVLQEYQDRFDSVWGKHIRDAGRALTMFDRFEDKHYNTLVEIIEPDDIINLTNGESVTRTVARLVARSPRGMISLMSAYIR